MITVHQPRARGDERVVRFENEGLVLVNETSDWLSFRTEQGQSLRIHRHYESMAEQKALEDFDRRHNVPEAERQSELRVVPTRDTVRFGPDVRTYVLHLEDGHLHFEPSALSSLMDVIEG